MPAPQVAGGVSNALLARAMARNPAPPAHGMGMSAAGGAQLARALANRPQQAVLARQDAGVTTAPASEADVSAHRESQEERRDFLADEHKAEDHTPSTGMGRFDAEWTPGVLTIDVRCKFTFEDGVATDYPTAPPEALRWTQEAKDNWKATFMSQVSSKWSGNHTFHSQRDWWEDLSARTTVNVTESSEDPHFDCTVTKIPPGEFRTSSVNVPSWWSSNMPSWLGGGGAVGATFDSEDVNSVNKPGGTQRASVHEAGHMLGLDDEYTASGPGAPAHSALSEKDGGAAIAKGEDGRIMSGGEDIQPQHGVTFLEVLREIAEEAQWGTAVKAARLVPVGADAGDGGTSLPGGVPDAGAP